MERITAKYYIETPYALEKAAAVLAGEQSSGTFVAVPGETEELKARFAARVEKITPLETVTGPAIPGAASKDGLYHRANIEVSWSIENFGYTAGDGFNLAGKPVRDNPVYGFKADGY